MFKKSMSASKHIPMAFTHSGKLTGPFSLIINNRPLAFTNQFKRMIDKCSFYVCADGGANRLLDAIKTDGQILQKLPDCVVGDMDSLRTDTSSYFKERDVRIIHNPDQNSNDIEKAFEVSLEILKSKNVRSESAKSSAININNESNSTNQISKNFSAFEIIVWRFLGSRIDHLMFSYQVQHFLIGSFEQPNEFE